MYRSLFTIAVLCGLTLSFILTWMAAPPIPRGGEAGGESITDAEAYRVASELVERRNNALVAHDSAALAQLTATDSPARHADEAVLAALPELATLETFVIDVRVHSRTQWEVDSVQYQIQAEGEAAQGPQAERCALWDMAENPWRLVSTGECGEVG